jgi:hypothetical protein
MKVMLRSVAVFVLVSIAMAPLYLWAKSEEKAGYFIKYGVSKQKAIIISASTPYDSSIKARDAFLHWFVRGFEAVLTGRAPMVVEWKDSPEGKAGQKGYDFGMDEAERYLKLKEKPDNSIIIAPIPPL